MEDNNIVDLRIRGKRFLLEVSYSPFDGKYYITMTEAKQWRDTDDGDYLEYETHDFVEVVD